MTDSTTLDRLFGGALVLRQSAAGHRIGTDAVLLAASCAGMTGRICDLGSGVGAVGLRIAQTCPGAEIDLAEIDPVGHALAEENIALNALDDRVQAHCVDILGEDFTRGEAGPPPRSCDAVVTNPPFFDVGQGRASPDPGKRRAHGMNATIDAWMRAAESRLRPKGCILMIHRADALGRLLAAMAGRFGDVRLRFIHPAADRPANRVLLRAQLGSRAPLAVLPPLALHDATGAFTPEAEAIHRGAAPIGWR